ncbi:MAG: C39 family peptidase [Longimicrobiales bacterium]
MVVSTELTLDILSQPDDETCGPTCLHAVYRYHGRPKPLQTLISEVTPLTTGGTLAVYLGHHALRSGYDAFLYTFNLDVFDPTWFDGPDVDLEERLDARARARPGGRLATAAAAYREFVRLGGVVRFEELMPDIIRRHLQDGHPILTGLSATYLYGCARERAEGSRLVYDDVDGDPTGHFVVVHGYDPSSDSVLVADPLRENPRGAQSYRVGVLRLLGAIMLGVLTYDGNMLVLIPPEDAP